MLTIIIGIKSRDVIRLSIKLFVKLIDNMNISTQSHIIINPCSRFLYLIQVMFKININASIKSSKAQNVEEYNVSKSFSIPKELYIRESL